MNRIRHACIELAPELEPDFLTSHHDDEPGVLQTYSFRSRVGVSHLLSGSPVIVGIIDAVITGALAAIVCQALGGGVELQVLLGLLVAFATAALLGAMANRRVRQLRRDYRPLFPS